MRRRTKEKPASVDEASAFQRVRQEWQEKLAQSPLSHYWLGLPALHRRWIRILMGFVVILLLIPFPRTESKGDEKALTPQRVEVNLNRTPLDEQNASRTEQSKAELVRSAWISYRVQEGDTLSQLFRSHDLSLADLNDLIRIEGVDQPLSRIRPGQLIRYKLNKAGELDILQLEKEDQSIMFFRLSEGGFARSQ